MSRSCSSRCSCWPPFAPSSLAFFEGAWVARYGLRDPKQSQEEKSLRPGCQDLMRRFRVEAKK